MENIFKDARYTIRLLAKSPAFTLTAVLSLGLGIAASALIFSVVDAVLLRPLPFKESDRLVWIWSMSAKSPLKQHVSYPDFLDWISQNRTFESIVGTGGYEMVLTGVGEPQRLQALLTMGDFFGTLGVSPMLGTTHSSVGADSQQGSVVISHRLWRYNFNSDPAAVGRQITLSDKPFTVAGVMPESFQFPLRSSVPVDLWFTLETFNPALQKRRDARLIEVIGRLRPNVTLAQAQAEMDVIAKNLSASYPMSNREMGIRIVPGIDEVAGDVSRPLLVLFGAVTALLLIACVNVANLTIARSIRRRQEIAVRIALGASRSRIAGHLLVESLILGAAGGVVGCLLASSGMGIVRAAIPADLPRVDQIAIDGRVLSFTFFTSLVAGLILGVTAAWHALAKTNRSELLTHSSRTPSRGITGSRISGALVTGEIALALVLLTGAGLFMNSFWRLMQRDAGFDSGNVLTFEVAWPWGKYPNTTPLFRELQTRLLAIPGIVAASTGLQLPDRGLSKVTDASPFFEVEGRPLAPTERVRATIVKTQAGYFRAMGIPLIKGRDFTDADRAVTPWVAIINESMARAYFPNEDPIGKRLKLVSWQVGDRTQEIVGVARDVKHDGVQSVVTPVVYLPFEQAPAQGSYMVVRTEGDPTNYVSAIRSAIWSLDKDQPIADIQTFDQRIAHSISTDRFSAMLLGVFSALAAILAAVGLYGLMSYVTAHRTSEMAIRMALGARRADVLRLVLRQGMTLAIAGIVIGLSGAVMLTRVIEGLLFGVAPNDPSTLIGVTLLLSLIAAVACWIPARRAMNMDPVTALRHE